MQVTRSPARICVAYRVRRVVCAGLSSDEPEVNGGRINTPSERTGSTTNGTVVAVVATADVGGIVVDEVVLVVEEKVGAGAIAGDGSPPPDGAKVVVGATVVEVEVDVVEVGATVVVVDVVVVGATVVVVEVDVVVVGATVVVVEVDVVVVGATVVVVEVEVVVVGATVVVVVDEVVVVVVVVVVDSTTLTLRPVPNATTASESPIVPAVRPADAVESDPRRPLAPLPQHFNIALSRTAQV